MRALPVILLLISFGFISCSEEPLQVLNRPDFCYDYDEHSYVALPRTNKSLLMGIRAKTTCLIAPDTIQREHYRVIHSFKASKLEIGETIDLDIFQQVTNETPKAIGVSWYCVQTDAANSIDGIDGFRPLGENVDDYIVHHLIMHARCVWQVTNTQNEYFNLVAFAYSGEKKVVNEWLGVDQSYSNIVVERVK